MFFIFLKSFIIGTIFYIISLYLLTFIINSGDIVGFCNGIILSTLILICYNMLKLKEN
jgi:hypothetical protein